MNEKRELGQSGIPTSALGLGCWAIGGGKPGFQQGSAQGEKGAIAAFFRERGFGEADGC